MKTVQMTLGEELVSELDRVATEQGTTRSAFTRKALKAAIHELKERELERKHRNGYARKPVKLGEFSDWEREQVWGE